MSRAGYIPRDFAAATPAPAGSVTGAVLWERADIAALIPEWRALAKAEHPSNLFAQPAIWHSWERTLSRGARHCVVVARDHEGRLVGVLAAMIRRVWRGPALGVRYDYDPADSRWLARHSRRMVPFRQFSPILSLPATMLGPMLLTRDGQRKAAIGAICAAIAAAPGWDGLVLPIEESEAPLWHHALAQARLRPALQRTDRPALYLSHVVPFARIIARQPQKFRANMRRAAAAADRAALEVTLCRDVEETLACLARLAGESWKARGRPGQHVNVPYHGPQQDFFEDLLRAPQGVPPVSAIAKTGDGPVAMVLGLVHGETLTTLLTFWNGAEKAASPGILVMGALMDWAAQNGIETVDFNSNNPWLRHFADHRVTQQNMLGFAPTLAGGALARLRQGVSGLRGFAQARRKAQKPEAGA